SRIRKEKEERGPGSRILHPGPLFMSGHVISDKEFLFQGVEMEAHTWFWGPVSFCISFYQICG
ncbi:MAG: hypothetical protein LKF56_05555, partial [Prevotella sp.]